MPVTPTYPGIYIEEILSNSHTITAAPTSVTVFVGYTHPFKTRPQHYGEAVEIFCVHRLRARVRRAVLRRLARRRRRPRGVPVLRSTAARSPTSWRCKPQFHAARPARLRRATRRADPDPRRRRRHGIVFTGREPVDAHHSSRCRSPTCRRRPSARAARHRRRHDHATATGPRRSAASRSTRRLRPRTPATRWSSASARCASPVSSLGHRARRPAAPTRPRGRRRSAPTPLDGELPADAVHDLSARATSPTRSSRTRPLDKVAIFNLLLTPGIWDPPVRQRGAGLRRAQARVRDRRPAGRHGRRPDRVPAADDRRRHDATPSPAAVIPKSQNGALYFPYLRLDRPGDRRPDHRPAVRLRRRHLRPRRHQPRRVEGAGRLRDARAEHDRRRRRPGG